MRQIGKGQTVKLLIVKEVWELIKSVKTESSPIVLDIGKLTDTDKIMILNDTMTWLTINSMHTEQLQSLTLANQQLMNVWRSECLSQLLSSEGPAENQCSRFHGNPSSQQVEAISLELPRLLEFSDPASDDSDEKELQDCPFRCIDEAMQRLRLNLDGIKHTAFVDSPYGLAKGMVGLESMLPSPSEETSQPMETAAIKAWMTKVDDFVKGRYYGIEPHLPNRSVFGILVGSQASGSLTVEEKYEAATTALKKISQEDLDLLRLDENPSEVAKTTLVACCQLLQEEVSGAMMLSPGSKCECGRRLGSAPAD